MAANGNTKAQQIPIANIKLWNLVTKPLVIVCIAAPLGTSVPVGFHLGVLNAPANYMRYWCNETLFHRYNITVSPEQLSIIWAAIISIFLIGGAIGSFSGTWIAHRYGRKLPLLITAILYLIGGLMFLGCTSAKSIEMLFIGRLIVGLASGLATSTAPMYLAEIAPLILRGTIATFFSLGICLGVVVGQVSSLEEVLGTRNLWEFAISFYIFFILIFCIMYYWFPESPKYLYVIAGDKRSAKNELLRLRGPNVNEMIEHEIELLKNEGKNEMKKRTIWSVLKDPKLKLPLILVCCLQGGQQLAGINAVDNYLVLVFIAAGMNSVYAKWANLATGFIAFLTICFSPITMNKFNRRPIILMSCFVTGFFLIALIFIIHFIDQYWWMTYMCIFAIIGFLIGFQSGLGPLSLFIGAELFESSPRSAAMSMGSVCFWTANFITGMTFPILHLYWNAFVFLPYAVCCFSLLILMYFYLPETRNKDSSEVAPLMYKGFKSRPVQRITAATTVP